MARKKYPVELIHNLDKHLRLKQARMTVEQNRGVTLQELYDEMATYMGVSTNTVALLKSQNYNPTLIVAMSMAKYLDTTVDELYEITPIEVKEE